MKYLTLRAIVGDLLAIPASTIASKSAFSTGGRIISQHRARLHTKTVESLICLQNWLQGRLQGISLDSNIQDDNDEMMEGENATSTTVDVDEMVDEMLEGDNDSKEWTIDY